MDIVCWQFCCFICHLLSTNTFSSASWFFATGFVFMNFLFGSNTSDISFVRRYWKTTRERNERFFFFTVLGTTENIWGLTVMLIFCHVEFWGEVIRSTRSFQTLHTIIYNLALASVSIAYSNPVTKTWVTTSVDSELSDYFRDMLTLCSSL